LRLRARPTVPIPNEFANAAVQLLGTVEQGKHYGLAHVDPLGVIERFRFVDLARESARWAHLLRVNDLEAGARVVVLADRDRHWRTAVLGVLEAGGVAVPRPGSTPARELRATVTETGATIVLSPRPRPELPSLGVRVFSTADLDLRDAATAALEMPYTVLDDDPALILDGRNGLVVHSHAAVLAQAVAGGSQLSIAAGERVWCTSAEGSRDSVWLMLAAWHSKSEVIVVEETLDPDSRLELIHRLRPAAIWFTGDEYQELAETDAAPGLDLSSVRRSLVSVEPIRAAAFGEIYGLAVDPIFTVFDEGAVAADSLRADDPEAPDVAETEERREQEAAEQLRREAEEARRRQQEEQLQREAAEARRRDEEAKQRQRAEQEALRKAEHDAANARERAENEAKRKAQREAKERIRQEAEAAKQRRRETEQEAKARESAETEAQRKAELEAKERLKQETEAAKQRRRADKDARRKGEQEAKQRAREEARERAERERQQAGAEKQRERAAKEARAAADRQAKERAQEEERLRREEAKAREAAERAAAQHRLERERRAAKAEARQAGKKRRGDGDASDHLKPDIIATISEYGRSAPATDRDGRRIPPGPDERREAK
jgi:hypothetical protein